MNPRPAIQYIVDTLPQHRGDRYRTRPLDGVDTVTVHHTVSSSGPHAIALYHINHNEWPGIGYHFTISADGTISQTNELTTESYHDRNNRSSIGVAFIGDFRTAAPTDDALRAGRALIAWLREQVPTITQVVGHRDRPTNSTACPGDALHDLLETF